MGDYFWTTFLKLFEDGILGNYLGGLLLNNFLKIGQRKGELLEIFDRAPDRIHNRETIVTRAPRQCPIRQRRLMDGRGRRADLSKMCPDLSQPVPVVRIFDRGYPTGSLGSAQTRSPDARSERGRAECYFRINRWGRERKF